MAPSFEADIRPLFRDQDVRAMSFAFDLTSHGDVKENAADIYQKLAAGEMPCDGAWPTEQVQLFREWMESGSA
jgi:hypothetical protein